MTMTPLLLIFYGTTWPLCADEPLKPPPSFIHIPKYTITFDIEKNFDCYGRAIVDAPCGHCCIRSIYQL